MKKTILLTGAAGMIGGEVIRQASLMPNINVIAIDSLVSGDWKNLRELKGRFIQEKVEDLLVGYFNDDENKIDAVIHLAANTNTQAAHSEHLGNSLNAVRKALRIAEVNKAAFFLASSAAVYGQVDPSINLVSEDAELKPLNSYGLAKVFAEQEVLNWRKNTNLKAVIGRFSNIFGGIESGKASNSSGWYMVLNDRNHNSSSMIYQLYKQLLANKKVRLFEYGQQRRDYLAANSVADFILKFVHNPFSGIYNVGSGVATSYIDLTNIIAECINVKPEIEFIKNNNSAQFQNYTCSNIDKARRLGLMVRPLKLEVQNYINFLKDNNL